MSHPTQNPDPAQQPDPGPGTTATQATIAEQRHANWGLMVGLCALIDVLMVLIFATIGGTSHGGADTANVTRIAWPFLVGLVLAWLVPAVHRHPWRLWPAGVAVWVGSTAIGLLLRALTGGGISGAMPWITAGVLAVLLLGIRLITGAVARNTGIEPRR